MALISPSILSADFGNLERDIRMLNESEADWIHCDVMDGSFVPNISFGFPILSAVRKISTKPLDVHLMVTRPERYFEDFKVAGADILSIHQEATPHLDRALSQIRELGMQAGIVLNPATPVSTLENVMHLLDLILIMSVNPGFGGQKFIPNTYKKLAQITALKKESGYDIPVQIDGGVNGENASKLVAAGAQVLVAGSYVFKSADPKATIAQLRKA